MNEEKPNKPKPVTRVIAVFAVVTVLFLIGIIPKLVAADQASKTAQDASKTFSVKIVSPTLAKGGMGITLPGNVQASEQAIVSPHLSGYVVKRFVDIGDHVHAGQVLCVIESPELDEQARAAGSEVAKSEAGVNQALADEARYAAGVPQSKSEEAKYSAAVQKSAATLEHANSKLLAARSAVQLASLRERASHDRVAYSEADLKRAASKRDIAAKTLSRWKQLEIARAVSGQDVDEKQADYDSSAAQYNAAAASLEQAKEDEKAASQAIEIAQSERKAAEADVAADQADLQSAKATLAASKEATHAAVASLHSYSQRVRQAEAAAQGDKANADRVRSLQHYEQVVAPFDGVITARNFEAGDYVSAATVTSQQTQANAVPKTGLFGLANADKVRILVDAPEYLAATIHAGSELQVTIREFGDRVFLGTVSRVSGALDATSRTLRAEVSIDNKAGTILAGMYAEVHVNQSGTGAQYKIPANALVVDAKGTRVATVTADNTVHFQPIKIAQDLGDELNIESGLKGDEQIIVDVDPTLEEGDRVRIVSSGN